MAIIKSWQRRLPVHHSVYFQTHIIHSYSVILYLLLLIADSFQMAPSPSPVTATSSASAGASK